MAYCRISPNVTCSQIWPFPKHGLFWHVEIIKQQVDFFWIGFSLEEKSQLVISGVTRITLSLYPKYNKPIFNGNHSIIKSVVWLIEKLIWIWIGIHFNETWLSVDTFTNRKSDKNKINRFYFTSFYIIRNYL